MILTLEQKHILKNMLFALLIQIAAILVVYVLPVNCNFRWIEIYLVSLILPVCSYILGIGNIARLRFFDKTLSNPVLCVNSYKLNIMKQYLSNTHEQLFLALISYLFLSISLPTNRLYMVLCFSLFFIIGRICFAKGYVNGASGRSFGFALTFYSNVAAFLVGVGLLIKNIL